MTDDLAEASSPAAQRIGDELPAARVADECRPPAAAVQTTLIGGRWSEAMADR